MIPIRILVTALALFVSAASAAETPASEASIREMLRITEARKLVDGMMPQIEGMMRASMQQAMKGRSISAAEQEAVEKMTAQMLALMQEELSWEKLEPLYLRIYQKSFTQEEVDGLLVFYRSPAGTALIRKMPIVVQETMTAMQQQMVPMMQKIQAAVEKTAAEVAAQGSKKN